jgi:hypothetical protein
MNVPEDVDVAITDGLPPAEGPVVIDEPTVQFADGQHATFTRVTILSSGALAAELTRNVLEGSPASTAACATDTVYYSPASWQHVFTAPRGALTAWTWRRDEAGDIQQQQHIVATNVTAKESHGHAIAWLRRYAISDAQLSKIAELAFAQWVTVSDPETIALKFFFHVPPAPPSYQSQPRGRGAGR